MSYAGDLTPQEAWDLLRTDEDAVLVDVRTEAEWKFVGIPDTTAIDRPLALVEWVTQSGERNPDFVATLQAALADREPGPVVFLCRSGQRSVGAAIAATAAGIEPSYNVSEGFEGSLDEHGHRGSVGWRAIGLPWRQS